MNSRILRIFALSLAGAVAAEVAPARAGSFQDLYTAGHADIAVDYSAAQGLSFFYELSSTAVVNGSQVGGAGASADPSTITTVVPDSVLTTGDSRLPAPFAGNPLYLLLQTSAGAGSRPFLGFGAEEIGGGVFVGDTLSCTLTGFSSPTGGNFILYSNGSWSTPEMNTADGLSAADSIAIFVGGHDHYNLGFTTAGVYNLTLTAAGTLVGGGEVSTSAVFHFRVGNVAAIPEPSSLAMAGAGAAILSVVAARRRRTGCR